MNGIRNIISLETVENTAIRLYEEGLFYKAYEYSAYLFVKHIKGYQARKKFYKNISQEVVSIGFPKTSLETVVPKEIIVRFHNVIDDILSLGFILERVPFQKYRKEALLKCTIPNIKIEL